MVGVLCSPIDQLLKQELVDVSMDLYMSWRKDVLNTQWTELIQVFKGLRAAAKMKKIFSPSDI